MSLLRSILPLISLWVFVKAEICLFNNGESRYCDYGCCGSVDGCCEDNVGLKNVIGAGVGTVVFIIVVVVVVLVICCCRRRRVPVLVRQQNDAGVTVVQSSSTLQMNSVAANVGPVYPQYPDSSQYPQPGYPQPAYHTGQAQPPSYYPK